MEQLSEMIEEEDGSVLVVCNTKKKASELFTLIENSEKMCFHLSTSMCPRHRKDTIYEIKTRLKNGEAIIVVSTQLIEAGVDLDFNIVYREVAPLESIIQSGGRCNREGKMKEKGLVNIFKLIDKGAASNDYRTLANFACSKYSCNEKRLLQSDFFAEYYRDITRLYANPDEKNINEKRSKLEFRNVAEEYSIIDSATTQVFIYKYNDESRKLYDDTHNAEYVSRDTMRRISQYSVQLYDNFIRKNSEQIIEEKAGYLVWHGDYDPKKGIHVEKELDTIIL